MTAMTTTMTTATMTPTTTKTTTTTTTSRWTRVMTTSRQRQAKRRTMSQAAFKECVDHDAEVRASHKNTPTTAC
jgi:hypothetical protein